MSEILHTIFIIVILLPLIIGGFFYQQTPGTDGWWHQGVINLLWFIIFFVLCSLISTY